MANNTLKRYRLKKNIESPLCFCEAGTTSVFYDGYHRFNYKNKSGHGLGDAFLCSNPEDYPEWFEEIVSPVFRVGDVVEVATMEELPGESCNWAIRDGLKIGKSYVVTWADNAGVIVSQSKRQLIHSPNRFKLRKREPKQEFSLSEINDAFDAAWQRSFDMESLRRKVMEHLKTL